MDIEKAKELLRIAETKCLCTDDRLRPLKEIRQALAELEQLEPTPVPASPSEPKAKKVHAEKDISLPSTDYLRTTAKFCREHIGLDDFFKAYAYELERAANEIDRLIAENNLQTTIDILMDKEEQSRIGINPDDVEHKRENIQILCRILESYNRQIELLHRHRICINCGKQLSEAEAKSVHSCFDEQALKEKQ